MQEASGGAAAKFANGAVFVCKVAYLSPRANTSPLGNKVQNARRILEVADRGYVMRSGRIVISGDSNELISRDDLFEAYIGKTDTTHE